MKADHKQKISKSAVLLAVTFVFFAGWFIASFISKSFNKRSTELLSEIYEVAALFAGIYGLSIAKKWGYFKSLFGKTIILLSVGLLLQVFGQVAYTYLNSFRHVAVPYPSWPDIGFFGSIPVYIIAALYLAKGLNIPYMIKKEPLKLIMGIIVPAAILSVSYWFFLKGYTVGGKSHAVVFFDFGYPLGQAIYVSVALVILLSVGKTLGGLLKKPVLWLLLAFVVQYASDFNFLYQTLHSTWGPGQYGDFIYFLAYCVMWISLISLSTQLSAIQSKAAVTASSDNEVEGAA